jgi:hypothetical protein
LSVSAKNERHSTEGPRHAEGRVPGRRTVNHIVVCTSIAVKALSGCQQTLLAASFF